MTKKINENPEYYLAIRQVIGEQLKTMRLDLGMTQSDLSVLLGIRRDTISKIELGKFNIGIDTISKLAQCLDFYIFLRPKNSKDKLAIEMKKRQWLSKI